MKSYKFKYKKLVYYKTIVAMGHQYQKDIDRMDVYHLDGSITSISGWSKYDLFLGTDWVLFTKKDMEKEIGQPVNLTV